MHDELVMLNVTKKTKISTYISALQIKNQNKKLLKNVYSKHIYVYMNGEEHIHIYIYIYIYNREKQIHIYSYTHIYIHIN